MFLIAMVIDLFLMMASVKAGEFFTTCFWIFCFVANLRGYLIFTTPDGKN